MNRTAGKGFLKKTSILLTLSLMFSLFPFSFPHAPGGAAGGMDAFASASNAAENDPAEEAIGNGEIALLGSSGVSYTLKVKNGIAATYTYDVSRMLPDWRSGNMTDYAIYYGSEGMESWIDAAYGDATGFSLSGSILKVSVKATDSTAEGQIGCIMIEMKETGSPSDAGTLEQLLIFSENRTQHSITVKNDYSQEYLLTASEQTALMGDTVTLTAGPANPQKTYSAVYYYTVSPGTSGNVSYQGSTSISMPDQDITVTVKQLPKTAGAIAGVIGNGTLISNPFVLQQTVDTIHQMPISEQEKLTPETIRAVNKQLSDVSNGSLTGGQSQNPLTAAGTGGISDIQVEGTYVAAGANVDAQSNKILLNGISADNGNSIRLYPDSGKSAAISVTSTDSSAVLWQATKNAEAGLGNALRNINGYNGDDSILLNLGPQTDTSAGDLARFNTVATGTSGGTASGTVLSISKGNVDSVTLSLNVTDSEGNTWGVKTQAPLVTTLTFERPLTGEELLVRTDVTASGGVKNTLLDITAINSKTISSVSGYSTFSLLRPEVPSIKGQGGSSGSGNASTGLTGSWIRDGTGWRYRYSTGDYQRNSWKYLDGKWYHFDSGGYMQTGWIYANGLWYYLLPESGEMATGCIRCPDGYFYFLNADGSMAAGDIDVDGTVRHFNPVFPANPTYTEDPLTHIWKPNGNAETPYGAETG